ncbi:glycosyl transferase [Trinickia dabaoshanensis]|uniref:Glycosyl transferase n=1 Tax=Trinickia dabaoshanensis TaxID=564714 RepID=A0A2N7VFD2_9BURK|nr:glycosyltransferase family 2 protein [Trinickia dabaoshanensis]PMS15856.1 glycosyl transferase [Trinickia dabaoshanensis]
MTVVSTPRVPSVDLSISVVVYRPDLSLLARTLESLAVACAALERARPGFKAGCWLIDNGGFDSAGEMFETLSHAGVQCRLVSGHGNVGYGCGHNLAIAEVQSRFHLILNPDIDLAEDALVQAFDFLDAHPEAGLLAPRVGDDEGGLQYLCRRYPTLWDLFVRGFMPASVRAAFARRLARYEMRAEINERDTLWDPPIVSGCFMLFRTDALRALGGFDARYFLYFEDYDLSLRAHRVARVAYVPAVRVVHHGGGAARKGTAHIRMFAASAFKFYNRFGWKLL